MQKKCCPHFLKAFIVTVITLSAQLVYATDPTFVYGTSDFDPKPQYKGVTYTSSNTAVVTIVNGKVHIVGVGTTTITGKLGGITRSQAIKITPAHLTIIAENSTGITGEYVPPVLWIDSGFVYGETAAVLNPPLLVRTTARHSSAPGIYPVTISNAKAANYTITCINGTITMVADSFFSTHDTTKVYGDSDFYLYGRYLAGVTYFPDPNYLSVVNGKMHIIKPGPNIQIVVVFNDYLRIRGNAIVLKAPLTITADNKSKVSGTANPALTASYAGFVYSDTPDSLTSPVVLSTTATTSSPPGTYPIAVSGAAAANYIITFKAGKLKVTAASNNEPELSGVAALNSVSEGLISDNINTPQVSAALSPNGDGKNDVLTIANIEKYPQNKLTLINSSGAKIFEATGYDNINTVFNGRSNNSTLQQPGTYYYVLQYKDDGIIKSKTGYFVIKY